LDVAKSGDCRVVGLHIQTRSPLARQALRLNDHSTPPRPTSRCDRAPATEPRPGCRRRDPTRWQWPAISVELGAAAADPAAPEDDGPPVVGRRGLPTPTPSPRRATEPTAEVPCRRRRRTSGSRCTRRDCSASSRGSRNLGKPKPYGGALAISENLKGWAPVKEHRHSPPCTNKHAAPPQPQHAPTPARPTHAPDPPSAHPHPHTPESAPRATEPVVHDRCGLRSGSVVWELE
jgi:hypothetical protein